MSVVYKKLEEVCEILDSQRVPITAKDRKSGIYPYYGANGLQDHVSDYIFDDELVLLAEDGGNFGSKDRPIAYRVSGKCWVNNHAHVLKAKSDIHIDYLCYALMFYNTDGLVNGATRQKLTQAAMRQMIIPYRCMKEQEKIVDEISRVFHLIAVRNEELALLEQLVKSRFIELFGNILCDNDLPLVQLKDLADIGSSKRIYANEYVESGVPFYRSKEIRELGAGLKPSVELFIRQERYDEIKAKYGVPKIGDILIAAIGATIGYSWIVDTDKPFYYKDGNLIILSTKNNVNPIFLNHTMGILIEDFKSKGVAGSAQLALTIEKLEKMMVVNPNIDLQNQFAAFVEQTDKSKYYEYEIIRLLKKLSRNIQSWRENSDY